MKRYALLLFALLGASCGRSGHRGSTPPALPSVAVQVQTAALEPHVAVEEVVGTVRSQLRALVEAKVSGRVVQYLATPGALVKTGDLLAQLEVQEIEAKVDQARAMQNQAQLDFDRQKQLVASGVATRQEYDDAEAHLNVVDATLHEVETMLSYTRVTAPFDGVVTRKFADVGDLAMPGKPLFEIEAPTALRFEADLPEALLDRIVMGTRMRVQIASLSAPLEATVSEIAPVADPVSRTFQIKLDLPKQADLRTGQFGRVSVPVAETNLLMAPQAAVLRRGQMELVFVIQNGHAVMRLVKTGKALDAGVEVLSGLDPGERVVISNAAQLADGQPVAIQP